MNSVSQGELELALSRGIFSDLFAYRPRFAEGEKRDRTPLEDWMTECLASCLRALLAIDEERGLAALSYLANRPLGEISEIARVGARITVETQVSITGQRPDLVVFLGKRPWIVVESKIEHSATIEQLAGYAQWVRDETRIASFRPTLVFLTDVTSCPKEFDPGNLNFRGVNLATRKWSGVGRAFLDAAGTLEEHTLAKALCTSFFHQLEDHNMSNEFPSSKSLAAAQLFMIFGIEIDHLVNSLLDDVTDIGDFSHQKTSDAKPEVHTGLYYACRWAKNIASDVGGTIYAGLWFPETGSYRLLVEESMQISVSVTPKIFVSIENNQLLAATEGCPDGWHRDDEEFLTFTNYEEISEDSLERASLAKAWVRERIRDLKSHLVA
ncbi:hypothetical protein [Croceicoccus sp. YJ47]|uniref:hypothetical protein n=1 Tax=Croceicoccus sp. YJ47 TaxID=2798724 RepID=UPI0019235170|nr:hypothetical protein [Croceicoccus sp. YJ47]QQN75039.1 hypothetical protein JD971_04905 [Croceicoccus sp. YJ47]